jgi:protocatechuate 3,4-dioxygenase beta subunit
MLQPTASQTDADHHSPLLTRRQLVAASAALAALPQLAHAEAAKLSETAEDALGPFYPLSLPADRDFDLTRMTGHKQHALGPLLYVSGRLLTPRGEPIANAQIEVWQANAAGRYTHPGDTSAAPLDPDFQGYARIRSAADGSYRLKTILPGAYGQRTRHIHFDLRGRQTRLVTQMYFEGEARNETDPLLKLQTPEDRKTLISRPASPSAAMERDALAVQWDIVLAFG